MAFRLAGISPMLCIGQMERFQPFHSGGDACQDAPRRRRRHPRGAAVSDFRPAQAAASMAAPWDPRPKIRGDGSRRASPITMQEMAAKPTEKRPLESPQKLHECNRTYTRGCAASAMCQRSVSRRNPHFFAHENAETRSQPIARQPVVVLKLLTGIKENPGNDKEDRMSRKRTPDKKSTETTTAETTTPEYQHSSRRTASTPRRQGRCRRASPRGSDKGNG